MKPFLKQVVTLITALGVCGLATAETRVDEVWTCDVNDGKSMEDVRSANSKWVKFTNANVSGGGITSHIVTAMIGNVKKGRFLYVDSFPNLSSWTAAKSALEDNDQGKAIEAELNAAANCSENRLYSAEQS